MKTPATTPPPDWIVPERVRMSGGLGSGRQSDVQLHCTAGPYEIDLLVREHDQPPVLEIVGQVIRAGRVFEPVAGLLLELVHVGDGMFVENTETDAFGEFDLTARPGGSYGLRLGPEPDAPCVLIWEGRAG